MHQTLLSGTVAENIGYWDLVKGIDMGRVEDAARTANADEFIRQLPKGYDTDIGPRGSTMSGGQRQRWSWNLNSNSLDCNILLIDIFLTYKCRLAIARAVYQNSSILILDEATSALDSRSELLVRQALERLKNHTVSTKVHSNIAHKKKKKIYWLLWWGAKMKNVM